MYCHQFGIFCFVLFVSFFTFPVLSQKKTIPYTEFGSEYKVSLPYNETLFVELKAPADGYLFVELNHPKELLEARPDPVLLGSPNYLPELTFDKKWTWNADYVDLDGYYLWRNYHSFNVPNIKRDTVFFVAILNENPRTKASLEGSLKITSSGTPLCPRNCSQKGTCRNGKCLCNENYGDQDCSTNYNSMPMDETTTFSLNPSESIFYYIDYDSKKDREQLGVKVDFGDMAGKKELDVLVVVLNVGNSTLPHMRNYRYYSTANPQDNVVGLLCRQGFYRYAFHFLNPKDGGVGSFSVTPSTSIPEGSLSYTLYIAIACVSLLLIALIAWIIVRRYARVRELRELQEIEEQQREVQRQQKVFAETFDQKFPAVSYEEAKKTLLERINTNGVEKVIEESVFVKKKKKKKKKKIEIEMILAHHL